MADHPRSRPPRRPAGGRDRDGPDGGGGGIRGAGTLFELAFTFAGTLLAGMAIGYYGGRWLDRWLGTDPWLQLAGLMLGVVAAFRVLWRTLQRLAEDEPGRPGGRPPASGRAPGAGAGGRGGDGPRPAGRGAPRDGERDRKDGPAS